jgi:hypothetical protein
MALFNKSAVNDFRMRTHAKSELGDSRSIATQIKTGNHEGQFPDNRPETIAQRKLQSIINENHAANLAQRYETPGTGNPSHVIQRQIILGDKQSKGNQYLLETAFDKIKNEPTFQHISKAKIGVLVVVDDASSSAMPRTKLNEKEFNDTVSKFHNKPEDIYVFIPISQKHAESGLKADPDLSVRADGKTFEEIETFEDTGMVPIYDITGKYETIKKSTGKVQMPVSPNDLSAGTVILHELGHAVQYMNGLDLEDNLTSKIKPGKTLPFIPIPVLSDLKQLEKDIQHHDLKSPFWAARVIELSNLGEVFHIAKDVLGENEKHAGALAIIKELNILRLHILDVTKLWMEHDVMINVEHPFAISENEGIRLRHGEESDVTKKSIVNMGGRDDLIHEQLEQVNIDKRGIDAKTAGKEMTGRLREDSKTLLNDMDKLLGALSSKELTEGFPDMTEYLQELF